MSNVGVWIDHKKAVIVSAAADGVAAKTVLSEVGAHAHYSGTHGEGEKRYEERHAQRLDQFFDEVISQLRQPDAVLIFGPGEAKRELETRLGRLKTLPKAVVTIDAADHLTEAQILAKVREHYHLTA
jgi:stalled ribosome rescue protein Dom34